MARLISRRVVRFLLSLSPGLITVWQKIRSRVYGHCSWTYSNLTVFYIRKILTRYAKQMFQGTLQRYVFCRPTSHGGWQCLYYKWSLKEALRSGDFGFGRISLQKGNKEKGCLCTKSGGTNRIVKKRNFIISIIEHVI